MSSPGTPDSADTVAVKHNPWAETTAHILH